MTKVIANGKHFPVMEGNNFFGLPDKREPATKGLYSNTVKNLGMINEDRAVLDFSLNEVTIEEKIGFFGPYVNINALFVPNIKIVQTSVIVEIYFYISSIGFCYGGGCKITNNTTGEDKKFNAYFGGSSGGSSIDFNIKYPGLGIDYVLNFISKKDKYGVYQPLVTFSIFMYEQNPVG